MTRQKGEARETEQATVGIPIPAPDPDLFRHTATDDVLQLLLDNPYEQFTIRELSRLTDTEAEGNRRLVGINRTRVTKPDDPVLRVPQPEFHEPVRAALDRIRDELSAVQGVLVFGSVARGRADRQSDIDLWVLADDRADQHRANELAKELEQERFGGVGTPDRRRRYDRATTGGGDRYEFQILVETPESARSHGDRLKDVFADAITLVDSDVLRDLKHEVMSNA
jgi:predicted nucleotidyltransferase